MDQRQAQIRERAGLEESKLNVEFIDWLRKWASPLLFVILIAIGGYGLYNRYVQKQKSTTDAAFRDLEAASAGGNASPDALLTIASEYSGVRGVAELARLRAADAYLDSANRGIRPGATVDAEGKVENKDDLLSPEDKERALGKAADLFQQVADDTASDAGQLLMHVNALHGLAAIAETRGDLDKAKGLYEKIVTKTSSTYPAQAAVAKLRIDELPTLAKVPALRPKAELPEIPKPAPPVMPPAPPASTVPAEPTIVPPEGGTPAVQPEAKPAEANPAETKPADPKPADPKPADPVTPPKGG